MKAATDESAKSGGMQKTDVPCLYRYASNGVYYALVKHQGKQIVRSLETTEKPVAKRKLGDFKANLGKVDASQGKLTLRGLSERYLLTIQNNKVRTARRKRDIVTRLLADFPAGPDVLVIKVKQSDVERWLAGYDFGYASHNLYLECVQAIFRLAIADKILAESPAANVARKKVVQPIRTTPTFEEFTAIIEFVRNQRFADHADDTADFLEFLGRAGLGQAEASALTWGNVDMPGGRLTIRRAKTDAVFHVPIFPQLLPLFLRLRGEGDQPHDRKVFKILDGKKALATACKRLKLPSYSQRAFRRMFITRCIEKSIDVKVIAQWQGHQDGGKLILSTYSHVRNVHADEMAKKLV